MQEAIDRRAIRRRIRHRIRAKIRGTSERPRVAVFRSAKHIYVQAIDDLNRQTLAQASTMDPEIRTRVGTGGNVKAARLVGETLAGRLQRSGIETAVLDRGGYLYHGRVKALAEAARSAGLKI